MKKYKKKANIAGNALATARILCTVLLVCVIGYMIFVIAFQGWDAVVAWFKGKWFVFALMVLLFVVTAGLWLFSLYKRIKGFEDGR